MSTIQEYLESLTGKSIAVIGMGVSNTPLIRMLLRAELKVTVCDKSPRERVGELAAELESLGARLQLGEDYLEKLYRFDVIFRTPGLSPNHPELVKAAERGRTVTSEMELFFQLCPCKIIGVTVSLARLPPPPSSASFCGRRASMSTWEATSESPSCPTSAEWFRRTSWWWSCPPSS